MKLPLADNLLSDNNLKQSDETGYIDSDERPMKNSAHYEYSIVRETSEDFIDLRKILVLAPLLNRHHRLQASDIKGTAKNNNYNNDDLASSESLSFRGSIFETILNDKQQEDKVSLQPKDKDALLENSEGKSDIQQKNNLLLPIDNNTQQQNQLKQEKNNKSLDSWDKFNILLLKFLNNYIKQVKNYEKQTLDSVPNNFIVNRQTNSMKTSEGYRSQTTRRSSQDIYDKQTASSNKIDQPILAEGVKNLLTFACMAQSGNPMSNLTFNWSFGATNLPETGGDAAQPIFDGYESFQAKPTLLYSNENHTLHVILVRRLDTGSSLNPFQMSLVTLNVIVERPTLGKQASDVAVEAVGQSGSVLPATNWTRPSTVARSRYHSFYNGPRANQLPQASNNIRFTQEFEAKLNNVDDPAVVSIDLNEKGWQEQIGNILKCSVTNSIGTSEVCFTQINVAERLKSSSSSSSEYAKWRMPSLAQKSFLIISILIGCALIVFVASALLLGPHLKNFNLKHVDELSNAASSGKDGTTNTGQSSSSQKSSELGLLGNGESSLHGSSSDEENSARLTHQHHLHQHQHDRSDEIIMARQNDRLPSSGLTSQTVGPSNHLMNEYADKNQYNDCSSGYDRPRGMHTDKSSGSKLLNSNPDRLSGYCYRDEVYSDDQTKNVATRAEQLDAHATQQNSAGIRLLANLKFKSLSSKFKVDKISDLTDFASRLDNLRNLHTKNVPNSETTTTGISAPNGTELSLKMDSPNSSGSSTVFGALNFRHSLSSGYNHKVPQQSILSRSSNVGGIEAPYYLYNQSNTQAEVSLNANQMLIDSHNHRNMPKAMPPSPAYSNVAPRSMNNTATLNVMDEFIRQREVLDQPSFTTNLEYQSKSAAFYRSQSVRNSMANMNPHQAPVYLFEHDLNHQQQLYNNAHRFPLNYGPPVYPRTLQHQQQLGVATGSQYLQNIDSRPTIASRLSHLPAHNVELPSVQHYRQGSSINNRFPMPSYNHTLGLGTTTAIGSTLVPVSSADNYLETIDSHLDRLGETLASGHYQAGQLPNHHISYTTSLAAPNVTSSDQNRQQQDLYNDISQSSSGNQSTEHIYDTNAYATPEKTPVKRLSKMFSQPHQAPTTKIDERPRVSQLIQTFNSKAPE